MSENVNITASFKVMPVLPLRGLTVFPKMVLNFDVGREKSMCALEEAMRRDQLIFLVAQKDMRTDDPSIKDIFTVGTVARVKQMLRFPGDNTRILIEGLYRARINTVLSVDPFLNVEVEEIVVPKTTENSIKAEALIRTVQDLFTEFAEISPKLTHDIMINVLSARNPGDLADYIAQNLPMSFSNKQSVLEEISPYKRLQLVYKIVTREMQLFKIENDIAGKVREQIDNNQREYFLREQLKAIQSEIGDKEDISNECDEYIKKINSLNLSEEVSNKLLKEADRLSKTQWNSPESTVIRTYLDTCLDLPWNVTTNDKINLEAARKVLDTDHYGLDKVKDRILEFLAVKQLAPDIKGQIICLVGPPGVGKTSVGKSIARALGRKFARLSLGGVRDEADIRGHRKTYIGAMPGRIMTALKNAGSKNAVLLLDEIDKMSNDFRGDPSAAMLEVLDSEQNFAFRDHYLELPFDLSEVLFITTANSISTIPQPLLDRMEVIDLTSYTAEEKYHIAKEHLIPKQRKRHGLSGATFRIDEAAIYSIIEGYTREAGVRKLEREIASVCRKAAKKIVSGESVRVHITKNNLADFLGAVRYQKNAVSKHGEPGVVNGLAWTSVGGEILEAEVNVVDGTGKLEITGNLGTIMNESAKAALTYVRSRAKVLGIDTEFYKNKDIHIHFPEGAIPKDGPSAGITIATALVSALTGIPAWNDVAMTGEISIRGRVLPIGGLKEKTMAAYRAGIKTVIIPTDNVKDLEEIDAKVRDSVKFIPVSHIDAVIEAAIDLPHCKEKKVIDGVAEDKKLASAITEKASKRRMPVIRQ